jgi:hypothetical protein
MYLERTQKPRLSRTRKKVIRGGGEMLTWGVVGIFEEMHLTEIEI